MVMVWEEDSVDDFYYIMVLVFLLGDSWKVWLFIFSKNVLYGENVIVVFVLEFEGDS